MPVALEQAGGLSVIHFQGEINISSAAGLKEELLRALASGSDLRLDVELLTGLDVTALQLLWAAEREARGSGKAFTVLQAIPDGILLAACEAGLERFPLAGTPK
jgi:anti-anti-sigma factor